MVHRIQPKPHSRLKFFLRVWGFYAFLIILVSFAFDALEGAPDAEFDGLRLAVLLLLAAGCALLNLRGWARIGWFSPTLRESFLTVLEEGLLIEAPEKGWSLFLPWAGLAYRKRGEMLLISSRGALRAILSLNGIPAARGHAILESLRVHTGQGSPRRGLFAAEKVAAPFAPAVQKEALPPLPMALVPPPTPIVASTPAFYTNTPRQWKECLGLMLRPDWFLAAVFVTAIAFLSLLSGMLAWGEEWGSAVFMALFALYMGCRLVFPGSRRQSSVPGPTRMELTSTEIYERWDDGAWARFRLPAVEKSCLWRQPHVWCLRQEKDPTSFMFDVDSPLPPQLDRYRREEAPGNGWRAAMALLLMLLCGAVGYYVVDFPGDDSVIAQDFCALLAQPDDAQLREFAKQHFVDGALYDTPRLEPIKHPEGEGIVGYTLTFTEDEASSRHYGWTTRVEFLPDGELVDYDSEPASWCPCEQCTMERLEQ